MKVDSDSKFSLRTLTCICVVSSGNCPVLSVFLFLQCLKYKGLAWTLALWVLKSSQANKEENDFFFYKNSF